MNIRKLAIQHKFFDRILNRISMISKEKNRKLMTDKELDELAKQDKED
jgi:hypothetical protein